MAYLEHTPTAPLYHYTSVDGFRNILRSGKLWFSDLKTTNDQREIEMPRKQLLAALKRFDRLSVPPEARDLIRRVSFDLIGMLERQVVYASCLTPCCDDINFWQEYTERGNGISFSLRPRAIMDMHVRVQKVEYVDENSEDFFDALIQAQLRKLEYLSDDTMEIEMHISIVSQLLSHIYSTKHHTWKAEKEVRLTFAASSLNDTDEPLPITEFPDGTEVLNKPPLVRKHGNNDVAYFEIPFGKFEQGGYRKFAAIAEVIVGPNCEISLQAVEEILSEENFKGMQVSASKCQFR